MPEFTEEELKKKIQDAIDAETAGLRDKRDQLLKQESQLKADIQKIKDDQAAAVKAAEDEKLAAEGKWKELADKQKEDHALEVKNLREANQALVEKNNTLDKSLRGRLVDQDLNNQLLAAGVTDPIYMKAATALLKGDVEVVEEEGELVARVNGKSIEDHIGVWAKEEGKAFITAKNSGGGPPGGGGGGADDHEQYYDKNSPSYNAQKQLQLSKSDPDRHAALRKKYPVATEAPLSPMA